MTSNEPKTSSYLTLPGAEVGADSWLVHKPSRKPGSSQGCNLSTAHKLPEKNPRWPYTILSYDGDILIR